MRKTTDTQIKQKKREWLEFVRKNKDFFEELAKKVKR